MANCRNTQQLNITCGTDVVLHDKLMFDGEVFDPNLSVDIECNLVNSLGKRTSLEYEIADETLIIQIPWVDGRNAGCYGLEVKGKCNGKTWATYADSLIRYTRATVEGAAVVETEHDWHDVTQVVSYRYSDSPLDEVDATIDDNYGEPTVTPTYEHNKLTLDFKNLRGNGIASVEQTTVSTEDEGVNETTVTQDSGTSTVIQVRNGSKGSKGDKGDPGDSAIFDPSTGNISEMKQGTGLDELSPMSQKAVTEALVSKINVIDNTNEDPADLCVSDNEGYVIMSLRNGHIKTKKFDSSGIQEPQTEVKDADGYSYDDFALGDESGYVVAKFTKGHIKTKYFNSSKVATNKTLKMLCFGNSFTTDSMSYVPYILRNICPDIELTIGIGYIGGCPLVQQLANLTGFDQTLNGTTYSPTPYTYLKITPSASSWSSTDDVYADTMIADEEWDVVTFQQNGTASYQDWDTYFAPFIFGCHKAIFDKLGYGVKFGWLLTHSSYVSDAADLLTRYTGIATNAQNIMNKTPTEFVFPYGTAIQNLRTTSLASLGTTSNLLADTIHIQEGLPCLCAAYANTLKILEIMGEEYKSILSEQTRPTASWVTGHYIPQQNGSSVGVTDDNVYAAQVAAIMAYKKPYEVTDCTNFINS